MWIASVAPRRLVGAALVSLALLPACARKPKEVRVTPARTTIYGLKRTFVMSAQVFDTKGKEITGPEIKWESDRPTVATIDVKGVVTSVKAGRTMIKAKHAEITGSASVEVVDAASILVAPLRMTLAGPAGTKGAFHAIVKSSKGDVVDARPRWTSSDTSIATIDANGAVTSLKAGRVTVTAQLGEIANAADLAVTMRNVAQFDARPKFVIMKVGETQQLTPVATDEAGQEIADPAVAWTSSDPKSASVADGVVKGLAPGTVTITATSGARSSEVSVLVN